MSRRSSRRRGRGRRRGREQQPAMDIPAKFEPVAGFPATACAASERAGRHVAGHG